MTVSYVLLKLYFRDWGGVQVEECFGILQKVAHKNDFGNLVLSLTYFGTTEYVCLKRHMAGMAEVRI